MRTTFLILTLLALGACATIPQTPHKRSVASTVPTYAGYMGLEFEYDADGGLVGVDFVPNPYTETDDHCLMNNAAGTADQDALPPGHTLKTFCMKLVKPAAGKLTQIAVLNHGLGSMFIAVAIEFVAGANPIYGARILGQSADEASCISTGKDTISSSVKDGKIHHPLTISCIAVPPPVKDDDKAGTQTV